MTWPPMARRAACLSAGRRCGFLAHYWGWRGWRLLLGTVAPSRCSGLAPAGEAVEGGLRQRRRMRRSCCLSTARFSRSCITTATWGRDAARSRAHGGRRVHHGERRELPIQHGAGRRPAGLLRHTATLDKGRAVNSARSCVVPVGILRRNENGRGRMTVRPSS